ncbi:ABC transporter Cdr4 [Mollisia scopiformis]|uniref:ABC transporter Cdr4 n=1 Tax=Mollisia scopiformis TaxID=149040 RepID=A0A194XGR4_MOLSC|nr:ABC transporter Cdr4 [Mollisia scopiformis]KUJ19331.1 ABC transporter Cdr4 [Mollisia scopiformis]
MSQNGQLRLGVSFQNINIHGFDYSERYQSTVSSYLLAIPTVIWKNLRGHGAKKVDILQDFCGLVQSGEMLLVLGRPGSGCSTLLKALAGQTQGIQVDGAERINYEGISYRQMHREFRGECNVLAEIDEHFPELTVRETLGFAAATRVLGPGKSRDLESRNLGRNVSSLFNLDSAYNTKIGNAMIRGISGGEKKRTSISEVFIGGSPFQCWDNSTRGLDSGTALNFIKLLRSSTKDLSSTAIVSIYQASERIFMNFDKVTLLYEGRQIYFGPIDSAADYFLNLGFERSSRATTADFLTSVTHPVERIIKEGYECRVPRSPDDFADVWKRSAAAKLLTEDIDSFNAAHPIQKKILDGQSENRMLRMHTFPISVWLQIVICVRRDICRLRNNYVPVVAGIFGNTIIAIVVGSVFYDLPDNANSLDSRAVLIFFALMVNAFAPAFEVLTMWAQRPIVEKHARYAFYHPAVEGVASILCDMPNKIATSILFNICVYFMTNLRRSLSSFLIFYLFTFVTIMTMTMFFRMAGRLNPMSFAYESLMINEFHDRQFPCPLWIPSGQSYTQYSSVEAVCASIGSIPGQMDVAGSSYLASKYGYSRRHLWLNLPIIIAMFLIFGAVHLFAAEYVPAQRSKGDILLFNRGKQRRDGIDEMEKAASKNEVPKGGRNERKKSFQKRSQVATRKDSAVFHWNNVNYNIKTKEGTRTVLTDTCGWVKPGTLTALMGVTGAGKTSLLDVLACRTTVGVISGDMFVDGRKRDVSFQRKSGYVQQEDIHLSTATVREALEFTAVLRQPRNISKQEKLEYVDTVLRTLEMESYAEAVVGIAGDGLNVEQRKRLTIAVELVAKPELLLFLDEPTSGLDSQTAWSVCMLLRDLADNGLAILCTVHQPSSQIFQLFDRLLLLDKSGKTLYFGEIGADASTLIEYFESNGAEPCPPENNPAEWMLNITSGEASSGLKDWSCVWNGCEQKQQVTQYLEALKFRCSDAEAGGESDVHGAKYATSYWSQLLIVSKRMFQEYWRDPTYIYSKISLCAGVSLLNGLSFYDTRLDIQGLTNIFFSVFLISQLFSTVDQQVIPRLTSSRALFEAREGRAKTYSWTMFIAANILVELFWQTIASILIFATWYYPTGLWKNGDPSFGAVERGALVFGLIWLFCLWISTFSQAVSVGIEHAETAVQIATLLFWLSLVFCGVLVSPKDLPRFWIFVYRASPLTYFIDGILAAGLANTSIRCSEIEFLRLNPPSGLTCGDYLAPYIQFAGGYVNDTAALTECLYCPFADSNSFLASRGINLVGLWKNFGYLLAYVFFNVAATFSIFWLARVPKRKDSGGK